MNGQVDVVVALTQGLCQRIGEPRFKLWFADKTHFRCQDDGLVVGVPNLFMQDWLHKTFGADVRAIADDVFGTAVPVSFAIDPQLFQLARRREADEQAAAAAPAALPKPVQTRPERRGLPRLRRWRRLEDFSVGSSNRVAHAAAVNLVEDPEQAPNPLLLHGTVGTGKTHLLEGICAGLSRTRPEWRVLFVTAEEFTNRFVQAMHLGKLGAFRKHFRDCDALVLDDLHFFAKKPATQEEFLHTLDALQTEGRLVALSCDCHPRLAEALMPELTDRLAGGAVWGVMGPDHATRMLILKSKFAGQALVADEVLTFLAEQLKGNVRELEGAVHSIVHLSKVTRRPVDLPLAKEALSEVLRHSVRLVQLEDVAVAVCMVLDVPRDALRSKQRGWLHSHPRSLAMYLARKHTSATHAEIGKALGGRNHSTVVAAEKKLRQLLADNATLTFGQRRVPARDLVERIEREILR